MDKEKYAAYLDILREELVEAMGCTEPIAVAYAAALARQTLGRMPERVELTVSGNIIKNVKSVIVPHTGGRKGLRTAVAAGVCFGDAEKELQVLSDADDEQLAGMDAWLNKVQFTIRESNANCPFDLHVLAGAGEDSAYVHIISHHTNVVTLRRNDELLVDKPFTDDAVQVPENRRLLNVEDIVRFSDEVKIEDVKDLLKRQIDDNIAIVYAGLTGKYGAAIGKILLLSYGNSVQNRAKAGAGAGICYLYGGGYEEISHTIINALAINSGMICDGAKASCAAKIASAVEAGMLGMRMNMHDSQFYGGDGIVVTGVENTIRAVSTIAREGMRSTDKEVIRLMMENG